MARFVGIPAPPLALEPDLLRVLLSLKENVELLTNQRGEADGASVALTAGQVTTGTVKDTYRTLTARGAGVTVNNTAVPLLSDYTKLMSDVQRLANDVAAIRAALNTLITQLRDQT